MHIFKFLAFVLASVLCVECLRVVKRSPSGNCGIRPGGGSDGGGGEVPLDGEDDASAESQVINGEQSSEKWPWMASLIKGSHTCGGSVIDSTHIITAAHCFSDGADDPAMFEIHIGELTNGDSGQAFKVAQINVHESYDKDASFANDIAIMTLEEPLPDDVVPICLPDADQLAEGDTLSLIGFGTMQEGGEASSDLNEVHGLHVIGTEKCNAQFQEAQSDVDVTDMQVCTMEEAEEKGSCQGDSGGPLMQENGGHWTLVGLVSFSVGCSKPGVPTVFTKVAAYQEWISQQIGG